MEFLNELKINNNREWFATNKSRYELARMQVETFLNKVFIPAIASFDNTISALSAKQCMFRIYRDIRFSKDKTPYKTYFSSYVAPNGRKSLLSGYYLHIEPDNSFLAGGVHCPKGDAIKNIRNEIFYHFNEFKAIIGNKDFKDNFGGIQGKKLLRPPAGYPKNFEGIELLKFKEFTVFHPFPDDLLSTPGFGEKAIAVCLKIKHLNDFMNRALKEAIEQGSDKTVEQ